ncbi:MAG: competence/damage-inducible protein A [Candidatus Omnitrophica bacterium]|nr:competence/damage-inducible protein A [Candidatus Omnitrophota bacterium]
MKAEIIGIGTEILLGQIVNTNSAYLSKRLAELGIDVYYHTTVGDNPLRLYASIMRGLGRADIVITTGGLGPTLDDITLEIISKTLQRPLILKKEILRQVEDHFKRYHIKMPKSNIRQAYVPKGARWLKNDVGTAPGLIFKESNKMLVALPGPPRELIPMFERDLIPLLKKIQPAMSVILTRTIKTTGLAESQLHTKVKDFLKLSGSTTVGIYARPSQINLKITAKAKTAAAARKKISIVEKRMKKRLGKLIYGVDEQTLEGETAKLLKNRTIAIAESCTGGLLSSRLTDISGMSANLISSIVAYSNKTKMELLDISKDMLRKQGAVSRVVSKAMANNIRKLANTDIGIGITGIAGPGGGTSKKPVGLVYISISDKAKTFCREYHFTGERKIIKFRATQAALDMLRRNLA